MLGKLNTATQRADKEFRAMVGTSTTLQSRIDALTGFTDRLGKSAEKSASAFAGFDRSRQAVDRLRAAYDPLFAASKRYEAAVEELDDALQRGVINQTQYAQMTTKLGQTMLTTEGQAKRAGVGMFAMEKGTSSLTMQVQNASYQIGDFFVQIASGTDASRALAQQLPQLLGGFGMFGAVAGAAVAIGGALIPMFFGASGGAKDAQTAIDKLNEAINTANAAQKEANITLTEARLKYGSLADEAMRAAQAVFSKEMAVAQAQLSSALDLTNGKFLVFLRRMDEGGRAGAASLKGLADQFKLTEGQARQVAAAMEVVRKATDLKSQIQAADQLSQLFVKLYGEAAKMPPEIRAIYNGLNDAVRAGGNLAALDMASPIESAANAADRLARNFAQAVTMAEQLALLRQNSMGYTPEYDRFGNAASGTDSAPTTSPRPRQAPNGVPGEHWGVTSEDRAGRDKKGDKEGKAAARDLEQLQKDFMTEQELTQLQYDERLTSLDEARNRELLTEQEYNALRLQAQADFNSQMRSLDHAAMQEKLSAWSGAFGDLSSLMNTGNRKLFKIGKAAALAQAVVDGWSAATSAWDKGMKVGGPPVAGAFAAMSVARTGAMIASIKSTQFDGGGASGGGGGAASAAVPAAVAAPLEVRLSGISADTLLTGADLGSLLSNLSKEAGDRGYRLMVPQ